ncbi:PEP-CTERM sorting domain-containing protein [Aeoliella mucimassa]|uniref:Ice-binding protein C-terminal domain-containing protein n=1 Tax=Aeoliella mucimassa TaxID=2527972 RepID=A0A518AI39_9BACT|nr:PEP-CTERM sorting domain-containing protein [Aeoliella mucimassa]QDU54391.1 hypothetical protein Pan181_05720 [Aeoliella mucimassa]
MSHRISYFVMLACLGSVLAMPSLTQADDVIGFPPFFIQVNPEVPTPESNTLLEISTFTVFVPDYKEFESTLDISDNDISVVFTVISPDTIPDGLVGYMALHGEFDLGKLSPGKYEVKSEFIDGDYYKVDTASFTVVPEPSSIALVGTAALLLVAVRRSYRRE